MANEAIDPGRLRRRGSADAKPRIHGLQRSRRRVVKLVVRLLLRIARPEIEVRLVPDLEIPLRDFVDSVAIDQMLREVRNEIAPFLIACRRRNDRLVPERMLDLDGRRACAA